VTFECVAASIESASDRWFTSGPRLLGRAGDPAALEVGGEHFLDGGIVNSIRSGEPSARRMDGVRDARRPRRPGPRTAALAVGGRARGVRDRAPAPLPKRHRRAARRLDVHVLPTGQQDPPRCTDLSQLRYRDSSKIRDNIERAFDARRPTSTRSSREAS